MATAIAQRRDTRVKEYTYLWEGIDRNNRNVRGEIKAASETVVTSNLRRQGIRIKKLKRQTFRGGGRVNEKDITFFTRQLATMLKAGVHPKDAQVLARHSTITLTLDRYAHVRPANLKAALDRLPDLAGAAKDRAHSDRRQA